jgi:hypothetical protein
MYCVQVNRHSILCRSLEDRSPPFTFTICMLPIVVRYSCHTPALICYIWIAFVLKIRLNILETWNRNTSSCDGTLDDVRVRLLGTHDASAAPKHLCWGKRMLSLRCTFVLHSVSMGSHIFYMPASLCLSSETYPINHSNATILDHKRPFISTPFPIPQCNRCI